MAYYCCWALALALVACILPASVFSQFPPGFQRPPIPGISALLWTEPSPNCAANQVMGHGRTCVNFGFELKDIGITSRTVKVFVYEVFKAEPSATEQTITLGANEQNTIVVGLDPGLDMKQFVVMVYSLTDPVHPLAVLGTSPIAVALTDAYISAPGVMLSFEPGSLGMTNVNLRFPYPGTMLKQRRYKESCYQPNPTGCSYDQQTGDAAFALTPNTTYEFLPYWQAGSLTVYNVAPVRVRIQPADQLNAMGSTTPARLSPFCAATGFIRDLYVNCRALGDAILNSSKVQSGDTVQVDIYHLQDSQSLTKTVPVWNGTYTWTITNMLRPTELALGESYILVSRQFVRYTNEIAAYPSYHKSLIDFIKQYRQNSSALLTQTAGSNGMVNVSSATSHQLVYRPDRVSCRTNVNGACAYTTLGASKALAPGAYEFAPKTGNSYEYPPLCVTIGDSPDMCTLNQPVLVTTESTDNVSITPAQQSGAQTCAKAVHSWYMLLTLVSTSIFSIFINVL